MNVLGIETSCDETAVCLIETAGDFGASFHARVKGNALRSQAALHAQYGGVFPNLAKREHAKHLVPLLSEALRQAGELRVATTPQGGAALIPLKALLAREPELFEAIVAFLLKHERPAIDCIAVTVGPGLEPALWVGINFAKALAAVWGVPLVAVNHMEGHIVMPLMQLDAPAEHSDILKNMRMSEVLLPALALLISGGHTELVLSRRFLEYEVIGQTRDDAAGEVFDKVARLLDLPYPGGPEISRLAHEARERRLTPDFSFTRPMLKEQNYDFSFSGLKTAVRKLVEARAPLSDEMKMMIALEFEETVADVLVEKTLRAAEEYGVATTILGGGVSANTRIKEKLWSRMCNEAVGGALLTTSPALATDNALMIALAGAFRAARGEYADPDSIVARGTLPLA